MTQTLPTTISETIARSLSMHPTLLAEAMASVGRMHRIYSVQNRNSLARTARDAGEIAMRMADACDAVANQIRDLDEADALEFIMADFSRYLPTFAEAARILLLPRHIQAEICEQHDKAGR